MKEKMMCKKILYCASTASHILNFHLPYLKFFHEMGWQVDVAVSSEEKIPYADNVISLPLKKSLLTASNLRAVYYVNRLLAKNRYDIISAHTTLAGAVVRLAVLLSGKRCGKVVYTSHGYFFNGEGGLLERPYLWAEKLFAPVTEVLLVMNSVDYRLAVGHKLSKKIVAIPGMGLNIDKFPRTVSEDKRRLKAAAGFKPGDFLIVYVAEMSKRKNQGELIRAFSAALDEEPSLKLLLAGDGSLKDEYVKESQKCGLGNCIRFLGQVKNMASLYRMCDLAVSTSCSEGLPFNVMEAMACGLPVVASRIKGHTDLLDGSQNRFLYNLGDERVLSDMLLGLCHDETLREKLGDENRMKIQQYGLEVVRPMMIKEYKELVE